METIKISVELEDNTIEICQLIVSEAPSRKITFSGVGLDNAVFDPDDFFVASIQLREVLEKQGCRLLCNAARKNLVVSGMSHSMGGGRKGYIVEMGKQGHPDNLVDIFEPAESNQIVSVEEQKLFKKNWASSIGTEQNRKLSRKKKVNRIKHLITINLFFWPMYFIITFYIGVSFYDNMPGVILGMIIGCVFIYLLDLYRDYQNKDTF